MSWLRKLFALWALAGMTLLGACEGSFGDECSKDGDCKGSLTCFAWPCVEDESEICSRSCEQVCATNEECPSDRRCSAGLCVKGARGDSGPVDVMSTDDAGDEDAGDEDAGETDAGEADAGEADAGE